MNYYLAKTEPSTYSIDDLAKEKTTTWSGVRNPGAVKTLKEMKKGDKVLIYHSGSGTISGLASVLGNGRPDLKDEKSWLVDFKFEKKFKEPFINLAVIKESGLFSDFALVRQGRLSTMLVPVKFVKWLKEKGIIK
jgi:predicted RNA-binding protein with PUA-like domain